MDNRDAGLDDSLSVQSIRRRIQFLQSQGYHSTAGMLEQLVRERDDYRKRYHKALDEIQKNSKHRK